MENQKQPTQQTKPKTGGGGEKKISIEEIILITPFILLADLFEFLSTIAAVIPVVGQVALGLSWFLGLIVFGLVQFYLFMKGIRNLWFLAGGLIDQIPIVGGFPTKTVTWIVVILMVNNPKVQKAASVATGKAPGAVKK